MISGFFARVILRLVGTIDGKTFPKFFLKNSTSVELSKKELFTRNVLFPSLKVTWTIPLSLRAGRFCVDDLFPLVMSWMSFMFCAEHSTKNVEWIKLCVGQRQTHCKWITPFAHSHVAEAQARTHGAHQSNLVDMITNTRPPTLMSTENRKILTDVIGRTSKPATSAQAGDIAVSKKHAL